MVGYLVKSFRSTSLLNRSAPLQF
uniref:Uncharacterized protein n=1 Tax=Anguilla anguilla TaxID=7936 RepID=A0A0E9RZ68_ANGAN